MMNTGKKTLLALSVLALLSGVTGANAATLKINDNAKVEALEKDTDWAKHEGDRHWIYSQHEAMGNTIIVGEENGSEGPDVPYSIYGGVSMDALSQIATDAANNTITVHDGTTGNITGGQVNAGSFNAAKNKIDINGGEINGTVSGGIIGAEVVGGSAIENTVSISGGTVSGNITGGNIVSTSGDVSAKGNKVNISGDTTSISGDVYGANISEKGNVENNQVTISGGTFNKANAVIAGGYKYFYREKSSGDIKENSVEITGGTFAETTMIYGGYIRKGGTDDITNNGSVIGNQVTISNISNEIKIGGIYGGWNKNGDTKENVVTLTNSTLSTSRIYGGYSETGAVTGNQVTAEGISSVKGTIYGGYSEKGTVTGNQVIAEGNSSVEGTIYGGYSVDGAVTGNQVIVEGTSSIEGTIYGGYGGAGGVTGNQVIVNGGTVTDIVGGFGSGEVSGNIVTLAGGKITGRVFGGGKTTGNQLSGNRVEIKDNVDVKDAIIEYGNGTDLVVYDNGTRQDNTFEVKALAVGDAGKILFEGIQFNSDTFTLADVDAGKVAEGEVSDLNANVSWAEATEKISLNSFNVSGDELEKGTEITKTIAITGARFGTKDTDPGIDKVDITNLSKDHVNVTDKGVQAYGFTVTLEKDKTFVSDGTKQDPDKNNSQIVINASVNKSILAGKYTSDGGTYANTTSTGTISTETGVLTLDGTNAGMEAEIIAGSYTAGNGEESKNATGGQVVINGGFIGEKTVYGGYSENGDASGNSVELNSVENTGLTIIGGQGANVSGNTLTVNGTNHIKKADEFDAIAFKNVQMGGTMLTVDDASGLSGVKTYDVDLAADQKIEAGQSATLISAASGNTYENFASQAKSFSQGEGLAVDGTLAKSDDGNSLVVKVDSVKASTKANDAARSHVAAVGFLNEGSDLVLTGISSLAAEDVYGIQTFAATERSDSSYDGGTDIDGWKVIAGVGAQHKVSSGALAWGIFAERGLGSYTTEVEHGSGDVEYNGGGAALRYTKESGLYAEASVRLGKLHDDVDGVLGGAGYDTRADYKAFHAGIGKLIRSGNGTWNVYGKYFYTKADNVGFTAGGQDYELDSVESQRVRLGARYSQKANTHLGFYYGAAWEYEFDGDADGRVAGYALDTASLGGSTFIGEVGLTYKPQDDSRWDFELGVKGYGGERDGMSGILRGAYHF